MGVAKPVGRMLLLIVLLQSLSDPVAGQTSADVRESRRHRDILEQRSTILKDLRIELRQVSDWCHENGLERAAIEVTQLSMDLTTDGPRIRPVRMKTLPVDPALSKAERQWQTRVRELRQGAAKACYTLARKALKARLPSVAFMLIQELLQLDPDHVNARAILGQQEFHDPLRDDDRAYAGEWVSPYEAKKRGGRTPHVLHERFGWIPRGRVARYEDGMRPWRSAWHSVQKDNLIRRDFRNAWQIESEHFLVKTNVGLEEGVRLSRQLETYHEWLGQNFAAFFDTESALRARFRQARVRRGRALRSQSQMEVCYFATRDEYQRMIRGKVPPEIQTNGLYWQPDGRCYFFKNEQREGLDTLFHEATHQILDIPTRKARVTASRTLARKTGQRRQEWILGEQSEFWVIEGLACYFESFQIQDGAISVGRPDHVRIVAARQRLLRDNFYIPLETFCRLGKDEFQHHPNVPQLYSQASGLAHFLMHYDKGRYRDDLVRLLGEIYRPDGRNPKPARSLSELTGVPFATLDQQYREHMAILVQQVAGVPQPPARAAAE